ncbi:DNA helicase/exodeoxyribonuclease V, subunit A [Cohaesibacter sp. ES.047]|uniref:double-strand break repair helicase AddA n=1 Tax=Cohaesibacter sp. ES.047 TaxID=1798205 RepID=UPI000BB963B0|nr:double-strand break repair helicase AddA [Cohaesibacter sp. ES.047]SNY91761.1 DNA helicase/exodeoxyribonuclease V, subunit A [Cohaesibacter sp. ES.047]
MAPTIPADTLDAQFRAAHPDNSAWVSANAGSGKTFVLARRVVRLLLNGTEPSRILCLTFTKAAAAEMSNRVFSDLGKWTEQSDEELAALLTEIEGERPDAAKLALARRLFARALETPGGLKIQTIHAFAERLLHQFPLEANVPAHFEILDDQLSAELLEAALSHVLRAARLGLRPDWRTALDLVVDHMGDMGIRDALISLVRDREGFGRFMEASEIGGAGAGQVGLDAALAALARTLGVAPGETVADLEATIPFGPDFQPGYLSQLAPLFATGGKRDKDQSALMAALVASKDPAEQITLWLSLFRKKDGNAKALSYVASKKMLEAEPSLEGAIDREQARLDALFDKKAALLTLDVSGALFALAEGVIGYYERVKAARGLMDFDDLILKASNLLRGVNASAWVHYKLDQGIDHILVDEAQDTNPRQWEIISKLGEEFFTGESARPVNRTIFAVGDEKQSIYSFQGAEPKWFAKMRESFRQKAKEAGKPFEDVKLYLSFRSTPHVLRSVDAVFSKSETFEALSSDKVATVHEPIRGRDPGLVEVWPLYEPIEQEEEEDWAKPLDAQGEASPAVRLARTVAQTVRHWIEKGERLEGSGRLITAGDILILVRKRDAFVTAVNRALKEEGLPVAGADRLALLDHIAVMDLLALCDVMLLPEDDLSLATVLKSPLFGLSEARLFDLAHAPDGRATSLWDVLQKRAESGRDSDTDFAATFSQLKAWQSQIDFQPPFDFFAQILGPDGKRQAFIERLGPEADEVIDELLSRALDFEKTQTPNLQAFLAAMRAGGAEIKRDMGAANDQIRVMTVHGSKGLEAPIVFLIDGTGKPANARHHPHLVELPNDQGGATLRAWKAPSSSQPLPVKQSLALLDAAAEEEYLRLLYVGMTRAEDRLYLCGYRGKNQPAENCWYEVARRSLAADLVDIEHPVTGEPIQRWQLEGAFVAKDAASDKTDKEKESAVSAPLPDWFGRPAPAKPASPLLLQPSRAAESEEAADRPFVKLTKIPTQAHVFDWEPRRRGTLIHALIEHLPQLPREKRSTSAHTYLASMASDMPHQARQQILDEVIGLIDHPEHGALFSPESQAEVSLAGFVTLNGETRTVSGQVDRLIVTDRSVVIIDYKTNRHPPQTSEEIPLAYQTQMALYAELLAPLYPGKSILSLLLFTADASIMEVSAAQRRSALDHVGVKSLTQAQ